MGENKFFVGFTQKNYGLISIITKVSEFDSTSKPTT